MRWKLALVVAFCCLAVYLFVASYRVPPTIFQPLGGDAYIRIAAGLLFVVTIGWAVTGLVNPKQWSTSEIQEEQGGSAVAATEGAPSQEQAGQDRPDRGEKIVPWFALSTVIYAAAVFTIGYFVSTFLFLLGSMMMFVDDWKPRFHRLLFLSAGVTVALLLLFRAVSFYVPEAWLF